MSPFRSKFIARFRSPDRDRKADDDRLHKIRTVVLETVAAAARERLKLQERLQDARTRATFLAGTDVYEHETRQPAEAAELHESEAQMRRAQDRLNELEKHLEQLRYLERALVSVMKS